MIAIAAAVASCGQLITGGERTSSDDVAAVGLEETFDVALGEVVHVAGSGLTLEPVEVAEDSRCPEDVDCVWEGNARVVLATVLDGVEQVHALDTSQHAELGGARSVEVGPYRIELVGLSPRPVSDRTIPQGAYRVSLKVSQDSG